MRRTTAHHPPPATACLATTAALLTTILLTACGSTTTTTSTTTTSTHSAAASTTTAASTPEPQATSPGETIASVGGTPITRAQVNHWMTVLGGQTYFFVSHETPQPEGLYSDPPDYGRCVKTIETQAAKSPLGHARENAAELLTKCHELNEALETAATSHLIEIQQALHIANEQHITPTPTQITNKLNEIKAREYPTPTTLNQYLATHHTTIPDLLLEAKLDLIGQALLTKLKPKPGTPQPNNQLQTLKQHWTTQTTCQPQHNVPGCNHHQTPQHPNTPPPSVLLEQINATLTNNCYDPTACAKQAGQTP